MESFINSFLEHLTQFPVWAIYLFFFLSGALQVTFPPYPGDGILIVGGYLGSKGTYGSYIFIFLSYWIGSVIFSYLLFELSYRKGEAVLKNKLLLKYVSVENQQKIWDMGGRYGNLIYIFGKFFPGMNIITILCTGILGYKRVWAYPGIFYSSFIHDLLFYYIGRTVGLKWEYIQGWLGMYNKVAIGVVVLIGLLVVLYRSVRRS